MTTATRRHRPGSTQVGALCVAVMVLAGCGSADDSGEEGGSGADAATSEQTTSSAPAPEETDAAEQTEAADSAADDETATQSEPDEPEAASSGSEEAAAEDVVITIADFSYELPDTIAPGTEVTVVNEDPVGHTVTSDEEGIFDTPVAPESEATFTVPEEPGEYPFHCIPHPRMVDTLVVG